MNPLKRVKQTFFKWLKVAPVDRQAIDFVFSIVITNMWAGDSVWAYLIGPPGSMKTEVLRSFQENDGIEFVSNLRPRSIQSGYRGEGGKDPSLLPTWNNKTVILKDFTSILSKPKHDRESIIGDLRDAYDGFADLGTGNIGMVHHKSTFTIIAAVTPAIDGYWSLHQQLGERFVSFRILAKDRLSPVQQALGNIERKKRMRKQMMAATKRFLENVEVPPFYAIKIPGKIKRKLFALADLVAHCRSVVVHTGHNRALVYMPAPEIGTRLVQQLTKLCAARAVCSGRTAVTEDDYALSLRVGHDCLSSLTAHVLSTLYSAHADSSGRPNALSTGELAKRFSHSTAMYQCKDLHALGIVEALGGKLGTNQWRIKKSIYKAMKLTGIWGYRTKK